MSFLENLRPSNLKKAIQEGRDNFRKAMADPSGPTIKIKKDLFRREKKIEAIKPQNETLWPDVNDPNLPPIEAFDPDSLPEYVPQKPETASESVKPIEAVKQNVAPNSEEKAAPAPEATYTLKRKSILGLEDTDFKKIKEAGDTSTAKEATPVDEPDTEESKGAKLKRFLGKAFEKGKTLAVGGFEMVSNAVMESDMVRKMEMAGNQRRIDQEEAKIQEINTKITEVDAEIAKLEKTKVDLEAVMANLAGQVSPADLDAKLKVLDLKIEESKKKKAALEKNLEVAKKSQESFMAKRNAIAEKFIKEYEAKLKPMEDELAKLDASLEDVNMLEAGQEVRHAEELEKITNLEQQIAAIKEINTAMGMSERQNNRDKTIKEIEKNIALAKAKMEREKEELAERKTKIEEKITKTKEKALPFQEKKQIFIDVKENKPASMNPPAPAQTPATPASAAPATPTGAPATPASTTPDNGGGAETQKNKLSDLIRNFNIYLKGKNTIDGELIDSKDFARRFGFTENQKLNAKNFKDLLKRYYEKKRLPIKTYDTAMKEIKMFKNIN